MAGREPDGVRPADSFWPDLDASGDPIEQLCTVTQRFGASSRFRF
jgi:hypothetical protein